MKKRADLSQRGIPENQNQKKLNVLNSATQSTGFYTSQKPKLLSTFDETANLVRDFVESVYGVELAATLHQEALREYEKLIPDTLCLTFTREFQRTFLYLHFLRTCENQMVAVRSIT